MVKWQFIILLLAIFLGMGCFESASSTCTSDSNCSGGMKCNSKGECVKGCASDFDCNSGEYCNSGLCGSTKPAPTNPAAGEEDPAGLDLDTGNNQPTDVATPDDTGALDSSSTDINFDAARDAIVSDASPYDVLPDGAIPCTSSLNCPQNSYCISNVCQSFGGDVTHCTTDTDCPATFECNSYNQCERKSCYGHTSCNFPDEYCGQDGFCAVGPLTCSSDANCRYNSYDEFRCNNGTCVECMTSGECSTNETCLANRCVECTQNSECADHSTYYKKCLVEQYKCVECLTDADCTSSSYGDTCDPEYNWCM